MPGFFSRLFRRRNTNSNNATITTNKKKDKKNKQVISPPVKMNSGPDPPIGNYSSRRDNRSSPTEPDDELLESPPPNLATRSSSPSLTQPIMSSRSFKSHQPPPPAPPLSNSSSYRGNIHSPRSLPSVSSPVDLDDMDVLKDDASDVGLENTSPRMFSMSAGNENKMFSAGFNQVSDNEASDAESSSFNLSTDAEDTEYEALKKRGIMPVTTQDTNTYNTDGETSVFPNLHTDDEEDLTITSAENSKSSNPVVVNQTRMQIVSVAPASSLNKWNNGSNSKMYPNTVNSMHGVSNQRVIQPSTSLPTNTNSHNLTSQSMRRPFTTPKSSPPTSSPNTLSTDNTSSLDDPFPADPFADFADFSNFEATTSPNSWGSGVVEPEKPRPKPVTASDNSLTDLLAQAKSKSRNRGNRSVNSAPINLTSQYLREHHNLKSNRTTGRPSEAGSSTKSVSDIIKSLESSTPIASVGNHHKDRSTRSRRHDGHSHGSSSDSEESWLMDEVTGALGPRGIAADLESLSGRSRSSGGGRSHRSHKSKSRHRRKKSSGESIESVGSKKSHGSKRSRSSRYSHRSTRSYISQMSEQSRSVANDLLRLEMQLAMVGTANSTSSREEPRRTNGSNIMSASSRPSHRRTTARRSRITVLAPPGKLGIILANKADSKGTVVSGVRTSSVLSEKISPGDRIVAIDGEDVSMMTVSEITTIMARKSEYERMLTVLTTPRQLADDGTTPEYSQTRYR